MNLQSRAFSFVDRIEPIRPGAPIRGRYRVPPGLASFPASLVSEAIGQLAAWAAMDAVGFARRPVAGLAGLVEFLAPVRPGQLLELTAEIESQDEAAVAYRGSAAADGVPVLRLHDCVGPMLPAEEFDDPADLARRMARLTDDGAEPGGFPGLPPLALESEGNFPTWRARFPVPRSAALFADHFPRRPVFPGSLILGQGLRLVLELAAAAPRPAGGPWVPSALSGMKLRAFVAPGESLEFEARWNGAESDSADVSLDIRRGGKLIGGAGVRLVPGVTA